MVFKQYVALFFKFFSVVFLGLSVSSSVYAAENNVYDTNDQKVTIQILPKESKNSQSSSNLPSTGGTNQGSTINRLLPKTGEELTYYFSVIGMGLIVIIFWVYQKNRRGER